VDLEFAPFFYFNLGWLCEWSKKKFALFLKHAGNQQGGQNENLQQATIGKKNAVM
jgi:hypothetical protein